MLASGASGPFCTILRKGYSPTVNSPSLRHGIYGRTTPPEGRTHYGHTLCPDWNPTPSGTANVQKPGFLQIVSTKTVYTCNNNSKELDIRYRVLDVNQNPINISGMVIQESVSSNTGTCHTTITDSSQWKTDSTGTMINVDSIATCPGGVTCSVSFTQSFTVDGYGVLLLSADKSRSGTHNAITIACDGPSDTC